MTDPAVPDRGFFARPVLQVAPDLLGAVVSAGGVSVRLTEVEAYAGTRDPGSHAFRGPTPRTRVMFGRAAHLYVYFSYGMHWCVNVVCGPEGEASAVLLRAGEVVEGEEIARSRRDAGRARPHPHRDLARGPARLASALGLSREHDGLDLLDPRSSVEVRLGSGRRPGVSTGPRVGVSGDGGDASLYPWRFWLTDDPTVSVYRPATPRPVR
ncbi:DNA-3-methyladenine glycosylase [Ornithinimicrobium tianjinense]|uniref:Putative 3-methyladenine DNA glycosylase n=1 Tax=Ornithinimicrobium tianjinense TaxID=1195761 RepID=A0A917BK41_9MICO|nr:DNA-3-methyladenine glycosylase [Ornithinimicrobium tianjinense]GGF48746.1 putative 3-methyladenine DNA glycosylase [Ornithinimicrobium tianjinense]